EIQGVFDRHAVEAVSVEQLFFNRNARTALAVGHARGVVLLAAALAGIDVAEYTPPQVKQAVTGVGSASKEQVGFMISRLLNLPAPPRPDDAADALAVALCHLQHGRTIARWAREGGA
ncbi:MAG TPA: crossover junction endodeoxyribonuclease RuvC, partial [Limnochordia bacterium]